MDLLRFNEWQAYHGSDLIIRLKELHYLGFVGGFDSGEATGGEHRLVLGSRRQVVELSAGVGHARYVVFLAKDADASADGDSRALVVAGDHDHSDASLTAQFDGSCHLGSGGVQHAHTSHEGQIRLKTTNRICKNTFYDINAYVR